MQRPVSEICLIIPPSVFLLDERVFMSLGILKVAAKQRYEHSIGQFGPGLPARILRTSPGHPKPRAAQ